MSTIQAVILAAGRGSRLGGSGYEQPKCLLEIGRRRLIEHQLDALAEAGVGPTHLVVGYGADEIREVVGMRAEYIVNTRWSSTNSLYSFWLAQEAVQGDLIVLNCDVLFDSGILDRLLDRPGDALAVDSSSGSGREQMKIKAVDGRLTAMAKDLPAGEAFGENVGILKLTRPTAEAVFTEAERLIRNGGEKQWVGAAIAQVAQQRDLQVVDVAGQPWIEIDFPVDLARARSTIWPAIQGDDHRKRWRRAAIRALAVMGILAGALLLGGLISQLSTPVDWESVPMKNWTK